MKGYIENGKYVQGSKVLSKTDNTQLKAGEHERQRDEHRWELVQPYKDGQPSQEFIEAYPDESKEIYGFLPKED